MDRAIYVPEFYPDSDGTYTDFAGMSLQEAGAIAWLVGFSDGDFEEPMGREDFFDYLLQHIEAIDLQPYGILADRVERWASRVRKEIRSRGIMRDLAILNYQLNAYREELVQVIEGWR